MEEKIYFISHYDNSIHNITDIEHEIINNQVFIGKNCETDGFRIDEEVTLHTIEECIEFYKYN